jgi:hypothetical protein
MQKFEISNEAIERSAQYLRDLKKSHIIEQLEADPTPKGCCEFITNILFAMFATGNHLHSPGVTLAYGRYCSDTWGSDMASSEIHFLAERSYQEYRSRHPE